MESLSVRTSGREQFVNITDQVQALVRKHDWDSGILVLFSAHTTCGLTVNEAADPSVARDMLAALARLVPLHGDYRHAEGNSDAHIKTSLMGPSLTLIVEDGHVQLGTWQGIFLCEFDGPRSRTVRAKWVPAA